MDLSGHLRYTTAGTVGVFEIQAMGRVADLGYLEVGDTPWPVESSWNRANRVLTAAGLPYQVVGDPPIGVNRRDVDRQPALVLIAQQAADVGAAVFDRPDGTVIFQHYSTRAQTWQFDRWIDQPPELDWATTTTAWWETADISPNAPVPLPLDMCAVGWEPVWRATSGAIINDVTLYYGPAPADGAQRSAIHVSDRGSIIRYGRRHYGNETQLVDRPSAAYRAGLILDQHRAAAWAVDQAVVYLTDLTPDARAAVLDLLCGSRIQLTGMPQPAPERDPVRVVEGWAHTLTGTRSDLLLHLSDPMWSYAGIVWGALRPACTWGDAAPTLLWVDAITDPCGDATIPPLGTAGGWTFGGGPVPGIGTVGGEIPSPPS
jgi:hypothetical protein